MNVKEGNGFADAFASYAKTLTVDGNHITVVDIEEEVLQNLPTNTSVGNSRFLLLLNLHTNTSVGNSLLLLLLLWNS